MIKGHLKELFCISLLENQSEFAQQIFEALCDLKTEYEQQKDMKNTIQIDEYFSKEVILTRVYDFEVYIFWGDSYLMRLKLSM